MITYNRPPAKLTSKTPVDIIGAHNMDMFIAHYQIATRRTVGGEYNEKALNKEFSHFERQDIARIYKELRKNGYYPQELRRGAIVFGTALQSNLQELFESGLDELRGKTKQQLQDVARAGWRQLTGG